MHCGIYVQDTNDNKIRFFKYIYTDIHTYICVCVCAYLYMHIDKGCSFIELALNLDATTRKKKWFFKSLRFLPAEIEGNIMWL